MERHKMERHKMENTLETLQITVEMREQTIRQISVIKEGAARLVGEEELVQKLQRSLALDIPLTIKFNMYPGIPDILSSYALALEKLKQLQDMGHTIVVVIDDFTGRYQKEKAMTDRGFLMDFQRYQEQVFHILDKERTQVRCSGEWLELLSAAELLRLVSTQTAVKLSEEMEQNRVIMGKRALTKASVLSQELLCMLLRAYDSVELQADLEVGYEDQSLAVLRGGSLQEDYKMEVQAALLLPIPEKDKDMEK